MQLHCVTLSDFNLDNFNALLSHDEAAPSVDAIGTNFGQVHQYLLNPEDPCWSEHPECAIVWTRPEAVVPSFWRLRKFEAVDTDKVLSEVDEFTRRLLLLEDRVDAIFVPTWTIPPEENGLGLLDMRKEIGITNSLMRMNLRLAEGLADHPRFYVLRAQRWIHQGGSRAYNPKLWAMAKVPFSNQVFQAAASDLKAALRAIKGGAKKLIIVDLDNTLWGGVVGDDGWENIRLGGHDPVGEAFADFQHALKALINRGILLGIVSKNTDSVALEAFENHPEMVLGIDDFAGTRINWEDKARNVAALTEALNLGLQSVVFIDDNPFERARVREALPEVHVPEWPEDPMLYAQTLRKMDVFDVASLTGEDRQRASMYAADRKRASLKEEVQSLDQWLDTLGMSVRVESPNAANMARIVQLLNKTNQMNLRTRRMSEAKLVEWMEGEGRCLRAFSVSDRFGDSGLTGILSLERCGDEAHIADFVLSCRVMGRKVEESMLAVAVDEAQNMGAKAVVAEHLPTPKNDPCLSFFRRSGFVQPSESQHVFRWLLSDPYPVPDHIKLEAQDG